MPFTTPLDPEPVTALDALPSNADDKRISEEVSDRKPICSL